MSHDEVSPQFGLHDFLASRDEPCPLCRYNLRGLQGAHCPECGQELTLRVNLVDPVRGAYLAGLIGLACGFGFNALLLIMFIVLTISIGPGMGMGGFLIVGISAVLVGLLLVAWTRSSSRIRQHSRARRVQLAVAAWFISLLSMAVLAVFIIYYD